jgi:hypothetical protein
VRGAVAQDLHGAFAEWKAQAAAMTRCRNYLYSDSVNPAPRHGQLSRELMINVSAPDANSFRASQSQIAADAAGTIERAWCNRLRRPRNRGPAVLTPLQQRAKRTPAVSEEHWVRLVR